MVLWGATFNAVVVVGVVSLLFFRLPMAILWLEGYGKGQVYSNLQQNNQTLVVKPSVFLRLHT